MKPNHAGMAGFTLLEVLITVCVLAFGLLALAGLQLRTLTQSRESLQHAMVVQAVEQIGDVMRANAQWTNADGTPSEDRDGNPLPRWDHYLERDEQDYASSRAAPAVLCEAGSSPVSCTPAQLADYDRYRWREDLRTSLPPQTEFKALICRDNGNTPPTFDAANCSNAASDPLYIKVVWKTPQNKGYAQTASGASATVDSDGDGYLDATDDRLNVISERFGS